MSDEGRRSGAEFAFRNPRHNRQEAQRSGFVSERRSNEAERMSDEGRRSGAEFATTTEWQQEVKMKDTSTSENRLEREKQTFSANAKTEKTGIDVGKMVRLAVLVAIIIIMANTPLGFLNIYPVSITLLPIPVAIAAITVGPKGGALAGAIFGLSAFLRGFGLSPLATGMMSIDPILTFIVMVVPRIFVGLIPGLIYQALCERKSKTFAALVACLAAPITNTILFLGALVLLFGNTEFYIGDIATTAWAILGTVVVTNVLLEVAVGFVLGAAISRTLVFLFPGKAKKTEEGKVAA